MVARCAQWETAGRFLTNVKGKVNQRPPLLLTAHVATWPHFCLATILYVIPLYVARGIIFCSSRPSLACE